MDNKQTEAMISIVASIVVAGGVAWIASFQSIERAGLPALVWCVIAAFVINWIAFIPSWVAKSEHTFDLVGSLSYVSVTGLALLLGPAAEASSWLIAGLILIWAARLGSFLFRRIRRDGKDVRFDKLKIDFWRLLMTWTLQGLWVSLTAIAAWTAITSADEAPFGVLTVVGLVLWLIGFGIESKADAEKSAFKRDSANEGRFISSGLWAWSRHPNYFGEITLWVGIALIALPAFDGREFIALVSPIFVTLLLTRISGVPALERRGKKRWGDEPAYQQYVANVPVLIPRPPRANTSRAVSRSGT